MQAEGVAIHSIAVSGDRENDARATLSSIGLGDSDMATTHQPSPTPPVSLPAIAPYTTALNSNFEVVLRQIAEGCAASRLALLGCHSLGKTGAGALDNIAKASRVPTF